MNKMMLVPALLLWATAASAMGYDAKYAIHADTLKPKIDTAQTADTVKTAAADTVKVKEDEGPKKPDIAEKIKSSEKIDGLFTLYQDTANGSVQLYIRKDQIGQPLIYQSFSMSGPTSLYLNQNMIRNTWLFTIEKARDRIEFVQQNTSFYYDPNNAVSQAANVDVAPSIFFMEKVTAEDDNGYLISVDGLFISDKLDPVKPLMSPGTPPGAVFNLGNLNTGKSKYEAIRSFTGNTDVVVSLAYDNPAPFNGGGKDITDARYVSVSMQHSFMEVPDNDFRPRRDDPRVGYFGAEVNDLTSVSATPYRDFISRWHLEKKNPKAKLSEPVEPIVFWIENTTPVEYRQIVKEAGEKWNEAFEAAGFKNAVVMKQMPDDAIWDPADVAYNVIRWVSSPYPTYGAIGPSFFNPLTGQILGADITVEWRSGAGVSAMDELYNGAGAAAVELPWEQTEQLVSHRDMKAYPGFHKNHVASCMLAQTLVAQYQVGLSSIEALDANLAPAAREAEVKEMHKQFLYYLILHEMGHTLGLNHNMKASQMLSPDELNDRSITRKLGAQGSVMDYPSINVTLDRSKQGDYYTTKVGPYDIWAIEYGYTPFTAAEEEEGLQRILSRSTHPHLTFGNDADDMRSPGKAIDPRVNVNDNSNDMFTYGERRFELVNALIPKLKDRFSKPNQSYHELRQRYLQVNGQRVDVANALSRYIGGVYVDRSFVGQNAEVTPFTPVTEADQKRALALLNTYIYAPDAFDADAELYPYLQQQRRGFNFMSGTEDFKVQTTYMGVQLNTLAHILHPATLMRMSNSAMYGNTYSVAAMMEDLTGYVFDADMGSNVNLVRQNLQTEYVKAATRIVGSETGYDNVSRASALYTLRNVRGKLAQSLSAGDTQTQAHRANLVFLIDKALSVNN